MWFRPVIYLTTASAKCRISIDLAIKRQSKSRNKKNLKKTLAVRWRGCFWFKYLSDVKKQIKQNLAYFYTKNSKNRHLLSAIFSLFLDLTAIYIPLPISVQDFEQR